MKSIRRSQSLLSAAERRMETLKTGFGAKALALAECDEELEFARLMVEQSTEGENLRQVAYCDR